MDKKTKMKEKKASGIWKKVLGKRVFDARRHFGVNLAMHKSVGFHLSQVRGEHLLRDVPD